MSGIIGSSPLSLDQSEFFIIIFYKHMIKIPTSTFSNYLKMEKDRIPLMNRNVNNLTLLSPDLEYFNLKCMQSFVLLCCCFFFPFMIQMGKYFMALKDMQFCIYEVKLIRHDFFFFKCLQVIRFCSEVCTQLYPEQECISTVVMYWCCCHSRPLCCHHCNPHRVIKVSRCAHDLGTFNTWAQAAFLIFFFFF